MLPSCRSNRCERRRKRFEFLSGASPRLRRDSARAARPGSPKGEGEWRSAIAGPGAASARGPSPRTVRSADPAPRASREAGDPGGDIVDALAPHGIRRDALGSHDAGRDSALDLYLLADGTIGRGRERGLSDASDARAMA